MESITAKALPQLNENATPSSVEDDWIVNFFDKSRIVSDNEMQELWSRVLAGETNDPGTYSKRTVNFLSDLDKSEAALFTKLCRFVWVIGGFVPLVFDVRAEIYNKHGINFGTLQHLDSIGLVKFGNLAGFLQKDVHERFTVNYYGRPLNLEKSKGAGKNLKIGQTLLTRTGKELVPICGSKPVEGFLGYVKDRWKQYLPKSEC